ncbi:hypothetical protein [Methylobacterium sp.]|uniref:hypothetical protein n=1 Tax=Methylobacterium sp. TaxID=409 RepID=UPI003B00F926
MTDEQKAAKKGGRPRVYPGTEKRPTLTFRVRGTMHQRLQESAAVNEVSLSEEIERRLERSFEIEKALAVQSANTNLLLSRVLVGCTAIENWRNANDEPLGSTDWARHEPTAAAIGRYLRHLANTAAPRSTPSGLLASETPEVERIREMEAVADHFGALLTGQIELPRGPTGSLY